jgi:signal transduction histidine kinase
LAATALVLAGSGASHRRAGRADIAEQWEKAAATVRANVGGLRSALVDIYPASLHSAGLQVALTDLANTLRGRNITIDVDVDQSAVANLHEDDENLIFRVAQECLRNAAKHSSGQYARVTVRREGQIAVLEVKDDGLGFDAAAVQANPEQGHLGFRLLADLCADGGGKLMVASAPGQGTLWRLELNTSR